MNYFIQRDLQGRNLVQEATERKKYTDYILTTAYESIYGVEEKQELKTFLNEEEQIVLRDLQGRNLVQEATERKKYTDYILTTAYESIYGVEKKQELKNFLNEDEQIVLRDLQGRCLVKEAREQKRYTNDILKGAYESFY